MTAADPTTIVLQMLKDTQELRKAGEATEERNLYDIMKMFQALHPDHHPQRLVIRRTVLLLSRSTSMNSSVSPKTGMPAPGFTRRNFPRPGVPML